MPGSRYSPVTSLGVSPLRSIATYEKRGPAVATRQKSVWGG
ncbi:hypothetical protein [Nonomuraea salmonea]